MEEKIKDIGINLLIILLFIVVSFVYFYPVLIGKEMSQMDYNHTIGVTKEASDYLAKTGESALWTNAMFSGMPTYQIFGFEYFNIFQILHRLLRFGMPYTTVAIFFTYLFCFYILLLSFKIHKWLSALGAVAFALSSYNIIIIAAGHITKTYAIAYMAPVLAGIILTYNKKYILGGIMTTLALGLEIASNHPQITYYLAMTVGLLITYKLVMASREKEIKHFVKATVILAAAAILAVMPSITMLWTTYEYGEYSIRGESEILKDEKKGSGLDKEYALAWSYGVSETLTLLIPNAKGGGSGYIASNEKAMDAIKGNFKDAVSQQSTYWGDQPFTSGPVYFGAIIMFFFILGLFIVKDNIKWWILAATLFSIVLSWGHNFSAITDFFFYNVPLYNKFRTVSMTLVVASLTVPLLAVMAIKEILQTPNFLKDKYNQRSFVIALVSTAGVALLTFIVPFQSFISVEEEKYFTKMMAESNEYAAQVTMFMDDLVAARKAIFKADALRTMFFIIAAGLGIFLFHIGKLNKIALLIWLSTFIVGDLWDIDKRYLSDDDFKTQKIMDSEFKQSVADQYILKDTDKHYRVFNLSRSVFNDGYTPYFHKSIGGYHGAKLRRYQDVIDYYLNPATKLIINTLQTDTTGLEFEKVVSQISVLNMLNPKYFIINTETFPYVNVNAFGNAWFIDKFVLVEDADAEIKKLGEVDLKRNAIINKTLFADVVPNLPKIELLRADTGIIQLSEYSPNRLVYKSFSKNDEFAVFSEIYYPKGWSAYIDGEKTEHLCVNYILRGLPIPKGEHTIEFVFEPESYYSGKTVSAVSSILVILLVLGAVLFGIIKKQNTEDEITEPINKNIKKNRS